MNLRIEVALSPVSCSLVDVVADVQVRDRARVPAAAVLEEAHETPHVPVVCLDGPVREAALEGQVVAEMLDAIGASRGP